MEKNTPDIVFPVIRVSTKIPNQVLLNGSNSFKYLR
jgi:hypothetical protein